MEVEMSDEEIVQRRQSRLIKMTLKPMMIGLMPSVSRYGNPHNPRFALDGRCGRFLEQLLNVPRLTDAVNTVNLIQIHLEPMPCESERRRLAQLLRSTFPDRVIMLGSVVAVAFEVDKELRFPLSRFNMGTTEVLFMPFPSNLNRYWNEPRNRETAAYALQGFVR